MQNVTKKSKNRKTLNRKTKALKKITDSEELIFSYSKFNGVFIALISNLKERQTHAYGRTKLIAGQNALENFRIKYGTF